MVVKNGCPSSNVMRDWLRRIVCLTLWLGAASCTAAEGVQPAPRGPIKAVGAADWPGFRGPHRDGSVASLPARLDALKVTWRYPVAGACDAGITVAGGRVVLCDHDKANDHFVCLDAATGEVRWKRTMPNGREMSFAAGPRATPLVHDGRAYVLSAFGELYCLSLTDGVTVWEMSFAKEFMVRRPPTWGYSPSPLIADGKLIVTPGGRTTVAALDPATGKVLWRGAGDGVNYASFLAGKFGGVEQVVGYDEKTLGGWDLSTGKRLWSRDVEVGDGYLVPSPLDLGGRLFVCNRPNGAMVIEFDADGVAAKEPRAANEDVGGEIASPVKSGEVLIDGAGQLRGLDAATLKTRWKLDGRKDVLGENHLLVSGTRLLAFTEDGKAVLCEFDARVVRVLETAQLSGPTRTHPALSTERLYVRDEKAVTCYEAFKGSR